MRFLLYFLGSTMNILVDSHILIWHAFDELNKKSPKALSIIQNFNYNLYFSSVNLWEISIKSSLNKPDFNVNSEQLANGLLYDGFEQLYIKNKHLYTIKNLPHIHKDPFDRLLLAQSQIENFYFLTADALILKYDYDFIIDATI